MTIDTLIMLSGAFVAALPFLGFPNTWDSVFFFAAGVFVISLGIIVRRRGKRLIVSRPVRDPHFIEHVPAAGSREQGHEEV
jgi:hypothetical protein